MTCNASNFPKDLPDIPTLTDDTIITVSDGSADPKTSVKGYKTTLDDIGSYIGTHALDPPVNIQDLAAFQSSVGTITISGATGTLSSGVDHGNLAVGDVLAFAGAIPATVVTAIGTFPTITIFPSVDISTGSSFAYGKPTLTTKDSSGNIVNVLSSEGIMALKTLLVLSTTELADTSFFNSGGLSVIGETFSTTAVRTSTYSSYPAVGYSDIRSGDDTYIVQRSVDDGMVTYYHRPMLNAVITSNQTISGAVWIPIQFNIVNGSDTEGTTHQRNVVGGSPYDTTNYAYAVPYGSHYSDAAYLINVSVRVNVTGSAGQRFNLSIYSGSSATGDQLTLARTSVIFEMALTGHDYLLNVSRIVYLKPSTNANHRYIRAKAYCNGTTSTIVSTPSDTFFSLACLG